MPERSADRRTPVLAPLSPLRTTDSEVEVSVTFWVAAVMDEALAEVMAIAAPTVCEKPVPVVTLAEVPTWRVVDVPELIAMEEAELCEWVVVIQIWT